MKPDAPKDQVEAALELMRRLGRELDVVDATWSRWIPGGLVYGRAEAVSNLA